MLMNVIELSSAFCAFTAVVLYWQVAVPGLEDRARALPPLTSTIISPGLLDRSRIHVHGIFSKVMVSADMHK